MPRQKSMATILREKERERERAKKEAERARRAEEQDQHRRHVESRMAEVARKNDALTRRIDELEHVLAHSLGPQYRLKFSDLKERPSPPAFNPGALAQQATPPQIESFLPRPPFFLFRLFPGTTERYEQRVLEAQVAFKQATAEHARREKARLAELADARAQHEATVEAIEARAAEHNRGVDEFERGVAEGELDAVTRYFSLVLKALSNPQGFPASFKIAYVPGSAQLVVEYDLPTVEVIPTAASFKYIKERDEIVETAKPTAQCRILYSSVVAQSALRLIHVLFNADFAKRLESIIFNGYVDAVDPATGQRVRPCLVTLRVTQDHFTQLDLRNVEPVACMRALGASLSRSPAELAAVRPVLEFSMVDPRFIQETDVLSGLDSRPNLMELSPGEFESLITNLFGKMGLDTKLTQASRDGGVDCVAYDPRPVLGGKVVIQAKRYRNTVGVSAVRDLFGTMHNEGASKGILVTTSHYGKAAYEFAAGKPLELLDGTNLLFLLREHAGVTAKIVVPDDWRDPSPDDQESEGQETTNSHAPAARLN